MNGKVFGIGVGPGDPDLLTIKAVNILNEVDIIYCPEKSEGAGSFAYDIAKKHIKEDACIKYLTFPMHYKAEQLKKQWQKNVDIIEKDIKAGKNIAFITLGDPAIYSTYMYMVPYLKERNIEIETVPGIPSFCLMADKLNMPVAAWKESFAVVPLRKGYNETLEKALDMHDNVIVMKPSHNTEQLAQTLEDRGLEDNFVLISKCGTEEENIITDVKELREKTPYLSTIIVKKGGVNNV